jgi:tetrahydromethanopterin S-methyltransferase subunit A
VLEHYTNPGVLDYVIEGETPSALYSAAIERGLLTRLDHAAYLGSELARAEETLLTGRPHVQDRAPGKIKTFERGVASCGCAARLDIRRGEVIYSTMGTAISPRGAS